MNKRSAIVVAAGLVVALIAGGLALSSGLVGPEPSAAVASAKTQQHRKPKIRTIKKTIKVHKKAKQQGTAGGSAARVTASTSSSPSGSWEGDDSFENEGEDDAFEGQDSGFASHEQESEPSESGDD